MKTKTGAILFLLAALASLTFGAWSESAPLVYRTGALVPSSPEVASAVTVEVQGGTFQFTVDDPRAHTLRLRILDRMGDVVGDSSLSGSTILSWEPPADAEDGQYYYELSAWDRENRFVGAQTGVIDLAPENLPMPTVAALSFDVTGNFTISGYLGVGLGSPERAVHIRGGNAVFRMDRSSDSAAFMLVRTDSDNNVLKSYVVGVNAKGTNDGSFVINDLGTAVSGPGTNRLTIANDGTATFTGEVHATAFVTPSAAALKTDIGPLEDALGLVELLQGVRFNWKETGAPSIGFIAEDVAGVLPEVVAVDGAGHPVGIDYGKLSAVLVEAAKSQQREIEALNAECDQLAAQWAAELSALKARLGRKKE